MRPIVASRMGAQLQRDRLHSVQTFGYAWQTIRSNATHIRRLLFYHGDRRYFECSSAKQRRPRPHSRSTLALQEIHVRIPQVRLIPLSGERTCSGSPVYDVVCRSAETCAANLQAAMGACEPFRADGVLATEAQERLL